MVRPGDPRAEFTEGPGTNELLTTNWKGSVKSQHVKYEKGALCHAGGQGGRGKKKGKKGPFGRNSSNHNKATHRSLAIRHMHPPQKSAPLPPHRHTLPFFLSFIDLNSFSASNTRNRPTFSHPLLCGRLIFGHLRSIEDHLWENKAPFQVGGPPGRLTGHPHPP